MSTETFLLSLIIHHAPDGAWWIISNDSWNGLLELLKPYEVIVDQSEWRVEINKNSRDKLECLIKKNGIGDKIVHTYLVNDSNQELFLAFDAMSSITINRKLGSIEVFQNLFPEVEIYYD